MVNHVLRRTRGSLTPPLTSPSLLGLRAGADVDRRHVRPDVGLQQQPSHTESSGRLGIATFVGNACGLYGQEAAIADRLEGADVAIGRHDDSDELADVGGRHLEGVATTRIEDTLHDDSSRQIQRLLGGQEDNRMTRVIDDHPAIPGLGDRLRSRCGRRHGRGRRRVGVRQADQGAQQNQD